MSDIDAEIADLRRQLAEAKLGVEANCLALDKRDAELAEANEAVATQNGVIISGTRKLIEARARVEAQADEIADLRKQLDASRMRSDCWHSEAERLAKDVDALRARVEALSAALRPVLADITYVTPRGAVNCRFCDEILDDEGSGRDRHDKGCVVHAIRDALAGKE